MKLDGRVTFTNPTILTSFSLNQPLGRNLKIFRKTIISLFVHYNSVCRTQSLSNIAIKCKSKKSWVLTIPKEIINLVSGKQETKNLKTWEMPTHPLI